MISLPSPFNLEPGELLTDSLPKESPFIISVPVDVQRAPKAPAVEELPLTVPLIIAVFVFLRLRGLLISLVG